MKINAIIPDDLLDQVKVEADLKHMNRTQYIIRALQEMVSADRVVRTQPEIKRALSELTSMLSDLDNSF